MTALTTDQFAQQEASLIASLVAATVSPSSFSTQLRALYASYGVSNPQLAAQVTTMTTFINGLLNQIANYFAGAPTGGTGADGTGTGPYYPITNSVGVTQYFPCPSSGVGSSGGGTVVGSLTAANAHSFFPSANGTTLTLPFTPPAGSLLDLYVGGVWQLQGVDYSLAGDVVTFTGPGVSTADSIRVRTITLA